jgi:dGTPase
VPSHTNPIKTWAVSDHSSLGRTWPEEPHPHIHQQDRERIVHSSAFRRLEYKTQVFVNHEGDMFRTRLTHSLEVAQLGRHIARALDLNEDLTEAIALAHDLGHTPFGHAGQHILNQCMKDYGGFEHNLQSLRIVDKLEKQYADFPGLNLTFETREGILKHCALPQARKMGDIGQRFLQKKQPSLEAQLTDLADAMAYNRHDLDDGLRANLLTLDDIDSPLFNEHHQHISQQNPQLSGRRKVYAITRSMVNAQINDVIQNSLAQLQLMQPSSIEEVRQQPRPLIAFSEQMQTQHQHLKNWLRRHLYQHFRVHRMSIKAENIIKSLFDAFMHDSKLLPTDTQQNTPGTDKVQARIVADYIAGMTDRYAILEYERIFNPTSQTW